MMSLMKYFPKQIAVPERIFIKDNISFFSKINFFNGIKQCYYSLYNVDSNNSFSCLKIDKIFFDFDDGEESVNQIKKLHEYCKANNYKHLILFSGKKGFHIYVFTKNYQKLKNHKSALFNSHQKIIEDTSIMTDPHIIGDIARVARVPNTFHITGRKYCIPITIEDVDKGIDFIKAKAEEQNFDFKYYCDGFFDISLLDKQHKRVFNNKNNNMTEYKSDLVITDEKLKKFLPCVQHWLLNEEHPETHDLMGTWKARYFFVLYCNSLALPRSFCDKLAKQYFSKAIRKDIFRNNYNHFARHKVIEYGYGRGDFFPSCDMLMQHNLCPGKCEKYRGGNSPVYK